MNIGIHGVTGAWRDVLDKAEAQGPSAIGVALELCDCGLSGLGGVESNNSGSAGSTTRLVLDFGLLDLPDGGKELNQIIVARRPRKLLCELV